jgi:hypothetical protein
VTAKVEVIRLDGVRFDKPADAYGEITIYVPGMTAEAPAFIFRERASSMPVLRRHHRAAFVWPFTVAQHPRLVTWVRFTDDAELHWEIDTSLHLKKLVSRDW